MTSAFIYSFSEMKKRSEGLDRRWEKKAKAELRRKPPSALQRRGETVVEEMSESVHVLLSMCRVNLGRNA